MVKIFYKNKIVITILFILFDICICDDLLIIDSLDCLSDVTETTSTSKRVNTEINDNFSDDNRSEFYKNYIEPYYPKAYVIRQKFMKMTCSELAAAINDIVYVFTKKPWFYFQDTPKRFRLIYYWEYVIDQLSILHNFFANARLNKKTQKIYWPRSGYNFWSNYLSSNADDKSISIEDYLKEYHTQAYADFYALAFDYNVKMFNEGILLKDTAKATRYLWELDYIAEKLKNTNRESDYLVTLTVCKSVLAILYKKIKPSNSSNFNGSTDTYQSGGSTSGGW